ncbi:MAG: hypothetical protein K9L60_14360 [Methylovulum sp.]|jgi:hypothetical protein|nr:hypothetical protein [Methylovulum sp.]
MNRDTIEIEINGVKHSAVRTITGTRKMFQSIAYNSKIEHDGHAYKSGEMISMDVAAKIILHQIVERG